METLEKLEKLKEILLSCGSVAVAFSGGVDSALLLKVASDTLGDRCAAVTAQAAAFPSHEQRETPEFCRKLGIRQIICKANVEEIPGFRDNPPDRCYLCKRHIFGIFLETAKREGFAVVAEGSNMDDLGDYRPGLRAIAELGIRSPLKEAGLTKAEIRALSRELGLPTWDKPSYACLASRFVYGETITEDKLRRVDQAEQLLLDLGFRQMRVRLHGDLARIEVPSEHIESITAPGIRERITTQFKALGFSYVTLDLQGFRTGSMNETLSKEIIHV